MRRTNSFDVVPQSEQDDQDLVIHFFIAFYALCYASLAEYTRFTETV